MSEITGITDLFAKLAVHLRTLNPTVSDEQSIDDSISNLNGSLNPYDEGGGSRVRVLDTVLSLMCFKAPQVFDSKVEYTVRTIVAVLSSLNECKVWRAEKQEYLQIGSPISRVDCYKLMDACADVIPRLQGRGNLSSNLLHTFVRAAVSAGSLRCSRPSLPVVESNRIDEINPAVSKLLHYLSEGNFTESEGIPTRLLAWHLDPLIFKHDILKILQEMKDRHFLCLSEEFHKRLEWRDIVTCLVLSPTMFIEARTLLQKWFLLTGSAYVLQLQIQLFSTALDILSQPTRWGMSIDMGSKLPFLHAYFPCNYPLLKILTGPLSWEGFSRLVHLIDQPLTHCSRHSDPAFMQAVMEIARIGDKSAWAMAVNFPEWFALASVLLFFDEPEGEFQEKNTRTTAIHELFPNVGSSARSPAAMYIARILCPINDPQRKILYEFLIKMSVSWTNWLCSNSLERDTQGYKKKLKRPKVHTQKHSTLPKQHDCQIQRWLEEFDGIQNSSGNFCIKPNVLFRKVPLGILLGCSKSLSEDGCQALLHYAATGLILSSGESSYSGHHVKGAVAGASLVFIVTDTVESMSASLFETEDQARDFICLVKQRTRTYLVSSVKMILKGKEIDGKIAALTLTDLRSRMERWRCQGEWHLFMECKDLDDVFAALDQRLSCL